jgi:hypothetical protein
MNSNSIFEYLLEITQEASRELLKIYHNSGNQTTRLVFSRKRNGMIRASELEMRFVLTTMIERYNFPGLGYSIESPTVEPYSFKGKKSRSAATDLSLYIDNQKEDNMELKAHNPATSSILKDIKKLVGEPCLGAWIHLLKNKDSGTLKSIINKLCSSLNGLPSEIKNPISYHFLILKTGTLISRKGQDGDNGRFDCQQIFNLDYPSWKNIKPGTYQFNNGEIVDENSKSAFFDWQVDKFDLNAL